ncbi:hypothetical protein A2865_02345 [Candidatus Woesebacteria bacterium RIFCSPHIGHO2_01_FULL_39_17]|uniref:Uncharacterized protein n=3 Tax=Candidatus Woeseibacteriota TaxID=1752722 RepID=A0A0G0NME7_9BACT|nr:MAG: hypothetical protein US72_C0009G0034 [Microgenomates group bacterium GW2011_GWC1_38_12]KKQ93922.1 MAG: hypothetical protein UT19_C0006G0050 [Candidatus Woesebacteria bacterium GW2011_GWB1_39_10b]KKR13991.1 MAG: hypothetical protein UT40_C0007G0033 [Candidatus Woesebacteria bacterium GW2011_GWA1_39_21b]OGM23483.1 MAG: hypothetical protein A2865_02345 [Candidatus Woesebacteria bacterium RIFCSPHIGHO2_01_FULL_39_17]OGM64272.1 MAG: hypothetical protein A3A52_03170 [Candidatus Woesebacteria b
MVKVYESLVSVIIKQQEEIIGPIAWSEAKKVTGLVIRDHDVKIEGDGKKILESLVDQYSTLFGRASVEVCREVVKEMLTTIDKKELPEILL